MAKYNLNEVLKARSLAAQTKKEENSQVRLDDVTRVKVLSPGRQVFKRFIRNRLAVFGSALLIAMFLFSFLGPVFYKYGQKDIFYTYKNENINYALAKENTAYNGYEVDPDVVVSRTAKNMMNSNIKSMQEEGVQTRFSLIDGSGVIIRERGPEIYTLEAADAQEICTTGISRVKVGVLDSIARTIRYEDGEEPVPGLDATAAKNAKGSPEFDFGGVTYTMEKAEAKNYSIYTMREGIVYTAAPQSAAFEKAMNSAYGSETEFSVNSRTYMFEYAEDSAKVYEIRKESICSVYTRLVLDAY